MTTQPAEATTKAIEDGGPAFPVGGADGPDRTFEPVPGMTLLDYFAAEAMAATIAGCTDRQADGTANLSYSTVAVDSYRQAKAMLVARKGGVA